MAVAILWERISHLLYYTWDQPLPPFSFFPPFLEGIVGYGHPLPFSESQCYIHYPNGILRICYGDYYKVSPLIVYSVWLLHIAALVVLPKKIFNSLIKAIKSIDRRFTSINK
jgi:hypothetical protein